MSPPTPLGSYSAFPPIGRVHFLEDSLLTPFGETFQGREIRGFSDPTRERQDSNLLCTFVVVLRTHHRFDLRVLRAVRHPLSTDGLQPFPLRLAPI
jgi:hypothetical protein